LAGPILPLYWIKPAGVAKLIGAGQIFLLFIEVLAVPSVIQR
jgi:hypothetical protein